MNERKNDGMQSRKNSFIESLTNVAIGYVIAFASQLVIFPVYGGTFTLEQNIYIGAWFTLISVIRSYVIRRWFSKKTERYLLSTIISVNEHRLTAKAFKDNEVSIRKIIHRNINRG
jgi:hypothetical protein